MSLVRCGKAGQAASRDLAGDHDIANTRQMKTSQLDSSSESGPAKTTRGGPQGAWNSNLERRMRHLIGQTAPWSLAVLDLNFAWRAALSSTNCPLPAQITHFCSFAPDAVSMQWSLYGPQPPPPPPAKRAARPRALGACTAGAPKASIATSKSAKGLPRAHGWLHLRQVLRRHLEAMQPSPDGPEHVELYKKQIWDDIVNQESFHRLFHCPPLETNNSVFGQRLVSLEQLGRAPPSPTSALHYQGQKLHAREALPDDVLRVILWELAEINFRLEMLQLDAMCVKRGEWDPQSRNQLWLQCFPDGERVPDLACEGDVGLGARDLCNLAPYALALGRLMMDWMVDGRAVLDAAVMAQLKLLHKQETSSHLVVAIVEAYVRTFCQAFGRPPTAPRVRPENFIHALPQSLPDVDSIIARRAAVMGM